MNGPSRFFSLAAQRLLLALLAIFCLAPSAQALRQPLSVQPLTPSFARPTSPAETRARVFAGVRVGRFCLEDSQSLEVAAGCEECAYKTASGRRYWLNQDPIGEIGGINLYAFVLNDPVNDYDPLGLLPPSSPTCQALKRKIENLEKEVRDRTRELYEDPLGLPGRAPGDDVKPSLSKRGHQKLLNMMKANLAAKKALYQAQCSDPEPPSCPTSVFSPVPIIAGGPGLDQKALLIGIGAAAAGVGALAAPAGGAVLLPGLAVP